MSDSDNEFFQDSDYEESMSVDDEEDEEFSDEVYVEDIFTERFLEDPNVKKEYIYNGGISSEHLSLYELTRLVSDSATSFNTGRVPNCDESLIKVKDVTNIDIAIAELEQKKTEFMIIREHLACKELIDPDKCAFNEQDLKQFNLHNFKKTY